MYASGGEMSRRSIAPFNTNPISSQRPVAKPIEFIDIFTLKEKNLFQRLILKIRLKNHNMNVGKHRGPNHIHRYSLKKRAPKYLFQH